jgi:hypothetical protein
MAYFPSIAIGVPFFRAFGSIDPDAQAFITAAGITDATQINAINTLVLDLKASGVWAKLQAFYPFVGGTATTHKYNLIDPRDLDAAFRIAFAGGVTHNSNGITGNAINGTANTFYVAAVNGSLNNSHLSIYQRNDLGAILSVHGAADPTITDRFDLGRQNQSFMAVNTTSSDTVVDAVGVGSLIATRTGASVVNLFRKLVKIITSTKTSNALPATNRVNFLSRSNLLHSAANLAGASIGLGLSDAESLALSAAYNTFNTTLGRAV